MSKPRYIVPLSALTFVGALWAFGPSHIFDSPSKPVVRESMVVSQPQSRKESAVVRIPGSKIDPLQTWLQDLVKDTGLRVEESQTLENGILHDPYASQSEYVATGGALLPPPESVEIFSEEHLALDKKQRTDTYLAVSYTEVQPVAKTESGAVYEDGLPKRQYNSLDPYTAVLATGGN